MTAAIVLAVARAWVPRDSGIPAAATRMKKIGKTATSTVVCTADVAQSYIAQARNSRRPSPSRSSHDDFAAAVAVTLSLRRLTRMPSESVDARTGTHRLRA